MMAALQNQQKDGQLALVTVFVCVSVSDYGCVRRSLIDVSNAFAHGKMLGNNALGTVCRSRGGNGDLEVLVLCLVLLNTALDRNDF